MAGIFFPWSIKISVLYVQGSLQDRPKPCANCDPVLVLFALLPSYGNPLETRIETPEATAPGVFIALIYCQCNQCSTASWDDFQHIYILIYIYIYTHGGFGIPNHPFCLGFSIKKKHPAIKGYPHDLGPNLGNPKIWVPACLGQAGFMSSHGPLMVYRILAKLKIVRNILLLKHDQRSSKSGGNLIYLINSHFFTVRVILIHHYWLHL